MGRHMKKTEAGNNDNPTSQSTIEPLSLSDSDLMTVRWEVLDGIPDVHVTTRNASVRSSVSSREC